MTIDITGRFEVLESVDPTDLWAEILHRSTYPAPGDDLRCDAEVTDLRARRRRRWSAGVVLVAAAVVATFFVSSRNGELVRPVPVIPATSPTPTTSPPAPVTTGMSPSTGLPPTSTYPVPQPIPAGLAVQPFVDRPTTEQGILEGEVSSAHEGKARSTPYGAGCSPATGPLPDGIWSALIVGADRSMIGIDLVCLYPQNPTSGADDYAAPDGGQCDGPFDSADPCMTNRSTTVRELSLGSDATIAIPFKIKQPVSPDRNVELAPATIDQLLAYLKVGTDNPFWVRVSGGVVTRIEEHSNFWLWPTDTSGGANTNGAGVPAGPGPGL